MRHVKRLSMSLDVPGLDLYHGGVLALVERPAINSIFLARRIVLDDRRPMRPIFHWVQRGEALSEILLRHCTVDGVIFEQAVRLHDKEIAQSVGRDVNTVLLSGIPRT